MYPGRMGHSWEREAVWPETDLRDFCGDWEVTQSQELLDGLVLNGLVTK